MKSGSASLAVLRMLALGISVLVLQSCAVQNEASAVANADGSGRADTVLIAHDGGDYASLKEALASAPEEVTRFILKAGIYTEWDIMVERPASIIGAGAESTIIQGAAEPGTAPDRIFTIAEGVDALIQDVTIRHGVATKILRRGGGILNLGTLRLADSRVMDNAALYGVGMDNRGRATVSGCLFSGNTGLTMNQEEVITGVGCTGSGGGIKNEPGAILTMTSTEVSGNSTNRKGGGIFVACESRATIYDCVIKGNRSGDPGGGIHVRGDLVLVGCTVTGNTAVSGADGIENMGFLDFSGNTIQDNDRVNLENRNYTGRGIYGQGFVGIDEGNRIGK
ncbi:MAG: hypothetical protein E4H20_07305 [Spirochaetales bacterium]|nr:MAG: hypothetical protein E4H20_07305 [Spirochaetales bacterium]